MPPDKRRDHKRRRIEARFGAIKDWRRIATRYDRRADTLMSAIATAASVIFRV